MTTSNTPRLYDILHERFVDADVGLPTQAALEEIESALGGIHEFLIGPAAIAVVKVANEGTPNSITHADIGRLIVWADHIADSARSIVESAAMVHVVARESYSLTAGYEGDGSRFTDYGSVEDRDRVDQVTRRFADVFSPTPADVQHAVGRVHEGLFGGSRA